MAKNDRYGISDAQNNFMEGIMARSDIIAKRRREFDRRAAERTNAAEVNTEITGPHPDGTPVNPSGESKG